MTNDSTLDIRERVAEWYNNLSDKDKVAVLERSLEMSNHYGTCFLVDEVLTPVYCEINNIQME